MKYIRRANIHFVLTFIGILGLNTEGVYVLVPIVFILWNMYMFILNGWRFENHLNSLKARKLVERRIYIDYGKNTKAS